MNQGLVVAVVGATGAVGREMVEVLEQRQFPVKELRPLASSRSAGEELEFRGDTVEVKELNKDSFVGVDIALFSAGGSVSAEYAPIAAKAGAIVIDNSSHFRMADGIPLCVPEVNGNSVRKAMAALEKGKGMIIANPNCSTIQMVVALKPLHDKATLKRVVVSTYQSVSGAGQKGMDELWDQTRAVYNQGEIRPEVFPHQIAFNCIPQIDVFTENGYTKEEMKIILETRKIMELPDLRITSTAVRVPVMCCHAESVNIETVQPLSVEDAIDALKHAPGVLVTDDVANKKYPLNVELVGTDATYVGRIRKDESVENGLNLWVVADNLRKGAALNSVQIAELIRDMGWFNVH